MNVENVEYLQCNTNEFFLGTVLYLTVVEFRDSLYVFKEKYT